MKGGESVGWCSEEGLVATNKDIRNYLESLSRKCNNNYQIEDVHHRSLERSHPFLIHITSEYIERKLCAVCKPIDQTVRTHGAHQSMVLRSFLCHLILCRNVNFCFVVSCMTHNQYYFV